MANKSLLVTPGSDERVLMCVTSAHAQNQQLPNAIECTVYLVMASQSLFLAGVVRDVIRVSIKEGPGQESWHLMFMSTNKRQRTRCVLRVWKVVHVAHDAL